jgi:CheY-like chemotaxis protein
MQPTEPQPTWSILLIEDDEEDYFLTKSYLKDMREHAIHLDWVSSFSEGLERIGGNSYDVALVDYNLGEKMDWISPEKPGSSVIHFPSSC